MICPGAGLFTPQGAGQNVLIRIAKFSPHLRVWLSVLAIGDMHVKMFQRGLCNLGDWALGTMPVREASRRRDYSRAEVLESAKHSPPIDQVEDHAVA